MPRNDTPSDRARFVRKAKADRQREIVEATVNLIGKYGVQGTTVSRIAHSVGISRGALYQHFPNREAVLGAALAAMDERSSAWIAQSLGDDAAASLLRMAQAHSSWALSEYNTFVRPFLQLIASNRETALTRMIHERQQRDLRELTKRAEEGQRQGSIANDVAASDVAWSILMLAWAEDIARLMGVERYITDGVSARIARRLMGTYAAPSPDCAGPASRAARQGG
jgi:AcrR family transcriptional regulator